MNTERQTPDAGGSPVDCHVRPCAWVRRNGWFSSGVANFGAECPPGWTMAAQPMYDQAALEAAVAEANRRQNAAWKLLCEKVVAAERERCAKIVDMPPGTEAWEVIGGEEGLTMLRELAAQIRGA